MNSIKDANLKVLQEKYPDYAGFLKNKSKAPCEIIESRSGASTLRYKGTLLHSSIDPMEEGKQFAERSGASDGDHILLYGLGLGYHVEALLEKIGPSGSLVAIEFNVDIFSSACGCRDLRPILSDPRFSLYLGTDKDKTVKDCAEFLDSLEKKEGKLLLHPPSFRSIPSEFKDIENAFELIRMEKRTAGKFSGIEERNFQKNKSAALESKGVSELYGRFKNQLGVLVSAGPSLDLALPFLELIQRRGSILATDTAYPILRDAGVQPRFVVSIDPQNHSSKHFEGYGDGDSILLFSPTSHPSIIKNHRGEKRVFITPTQKKAFGQEITALESKGETLEGGSVACVGLDLLARFGFNPIVLFGQDCCFSLGRCYASNSAAGKSWLHSVGASTLDDFHQGLMASQKQIHVQDRFRGKVAAHQNLYSYRGYIEQIIQSTPGIRFYNFHSMGLSIKNTGDIFSMAEI